jgi:DNA-binding MarR family transcriptional regulator
MALTEKGEAALADIAGRQAIWANALGADLGEERLRQATALITEIVALLGERRTPS